MAVAEIITIGTELLLGEIQDTNSRFIARVLRDIGVDLYRLSTVGDNVHRITNTMREAIMRADVVISTGGLGPTVDDPTRQAVADVFNVPLVYHPELWDQILERFERYNRAPTDNNKRQAYLPANAIAITNEVGTAPAFAYELGTKTIISLPGVPREMEYLMNNFVRDYLKKRYDLHEEIILPWVIHTISKGESSIDELIGELETLSNPTVGLLAHPGQTDVRVTANAPSATEAEAMMAPVLATLRERLGPYIYGENETTLEQAVGQRLAELNVKTAIIESGTHGEIRARLGNHIPELISGETFEVNLSNETMKSLMYECQDQKQSDMVLGVRLTSDGDRQEVLEALLYKGEFVEKRRFYGGPPGDGQVWAVNSAMDLIRRTLQNNPR